jgi:hypothetical protein
MCANTVLLDYLKYYLLDMLQELNHYYFVQLGCCTKTIFSKELKIFNKKIIQLRFCLYFKINTDTCSLYNFTIERKWEWIQLKTAIIKKLQ